MHLLLVCVRMCDGGVGKLWANKNQCMSIIAHEQSVDHGLFDRWMACNIVDKNDLFLVTA